MDINEGQEEAKRFAKELGIEILFDYIDFMHKNEAKIENGPDAFTVEQLKEALLIVASFKKHELANMMFHEIILKIEAMFSAEINRRLKSERINKN